MNLLSQFLGTAASNIIDSMARDLKEKAREERARKLRKGSIDVEFKILDDGIKKIE